MSPQTSAPPWYSLFNPETLANPYPTYHRLRAEAPVCWNEEHQGWTITRYTDVTNVMTDPRFSSAIFPPPDQVEPEPRRRITAILSELLFITDPPNHPRIRALVKKAFNASLVPGLRERSQQIADSLVDAIQGSGRADIIRDLALPLPLIVIAELLGVPVEDRMQFKQWTDDDFNRLLSGRPLMPEEQQQILESLLALSDYLRGIIEQRRQEPKPDLITRLALVEEQGDQLSPQEILSSAMLVLIAGYKTTTDLIGSGLLALLQNPEQMQKLQSDPTLIESAVEEFLRYESPVQWSTRRATEDIELHGKQIHKNQWVLLMQGAANRDPEQFPDPDRLDITRKDNRHVAFGHGSHLCMGQPLTRMNTQIAITTVLRRLPGLRLETDSPPEWNDNPFFRSLKSLPVTFS